MGSIIIAMPKPDDARKIGDMLKSRGAQSIEICTTGSGILSKTHQLDYGVVVCTRRLKDMYCNEILENLPEQFEMLLLVAKEHQDECPEGAKMVFLPFRISELWYEIDAALTKISRNLRRNAQKPRKRSREEQECIDRAKQILMDKNQMTEPEAFRYIQKCSMDTGTNLVETAQMILLLK